MRVCVRSVLKLYFGGCSVARLFLFFFSVFFFHWYCEIENTVYSVNMCVVRRWRYLFFFFFALHFCCYFYISIEHFFVSICLSLSLHLISVNWFLIQCKEVTQITSFFLLFYHKHHVEWIYLRLLNTKRNKKWLNQSNLIGVKVHDNTKKTRSHITTIFVLLNEIKIGLCKRKFNPCVSFLCVRMWNKQQKRQQKNKLCV